MYERLQIMAIEGRGVAADFLISSTSRQSRKNHIENKSSGICDIAKLSM
jgi:hypothetical protein